MNNIDLTGIMRAMGPLGNALGFRPDGTKKGRGYFGELQRPGGGVSTELSSGMNFGQGETQIPLLNPLLTQEEVNVLLSGGEPTPAIYSKAEQWARQRTNRKMSPFATPQEEGTVNPGQLQQLMALLPALSQMFRR